MTRAETQTGSSTPLVASIFVNFTLPDGGIGSIRVEGGTCCAAVAQAKALGTDIWIRAIDRDGHALDRVRVRG